MKEKLKRLWNCSCQASRTKLLLLLLIIAGLVLVEIVLLVRIEQSQILVYGSTLDLALMEVASALCSLLLVLAVALFLIGTFTNVHFRQWLFSLRTLRRGLMVLAWTATLVALFYGEENWRGRRAWNQYRQELEARGEQLDLKAFVPKPIPDEQNFAATPFIKSWFSKDVREQPEDKAWGADYYLARRLVSPHVWYNYGAKREFVDLVAWGMAFDAIRSGQTNSQLTLKSDKFDAESRAKAAPAVLAGLKASEPFLAELRAVSHRPHSLYPVVFNVENPWGILLPHLGRVREVCMRLQLKASAELAAGRSQDALEDVRLMFRLNDSLKEESFLISYLVRVACLNITVQSIWEGLAEHRWSEAQLEELQTRLLHFDFLTDLKRPLDTERAAGILTAELLYRQKYRLSNLIGTFDSQADESGIGIADALFRIAPHGWYYQEQLNYCRLYDTQLIGTFDAGKRTFSPAKVSSNDKDLQGELAGSAGANRVVSAAVVHHRVLAALLLPALGGVSRKAAMAQTAAEQAALACALERHRLANGQFPEKLEVLAPRFISQLPHDVINGEPYKYRRTEDGQFILYSVGWNEMKRARTYRKTTLDEGQNLWVWQYPARP